MKQRKTAATTTEKKQKKDQAAAAAVKEEKKEEQIENETTKVTTEPEKKGMSESEMINTVLVGAFTILFLPLILLLVVYQICSKKFDMEFSHSLIAGAIAAIATAFIGQLRFVFRIM